MTSSSGSSSSKGSGRKPVEESDPQVREVLSPAEGDLPKFPVTVAVGVGPDGVRPGGEALEPERPGAVGARPRADAMPQERPALDPHARAGYTFSVLAHDRAADRTARPEHDIDRRRRADGQVEEDAPRVRSQGVGGGVEGPADGRRETGELERSVRAARDAEGGDRLRPGPALEDEVRIEPLALRARPRAGDGPARGVHGPAARRDRQRWRTTSWRTTSPARSRRTSGMKGRSTPSLPGWTEPGAPARTTSAASGRPSMRQEPSRRRGRAAGRHAGARGFGPVLQDRHGRPCDARAVGREDAALDRRPGGQDQVEPDRPAGLEGDDPTATPGGTGTPAPRPAAPRGTRDRGRGRRTSPPHP